MKKVSTSSYAHALVTATDSITGRALDPVISTFTALVKRNGDWSRRRDILAAAEQLVRERNGQKSVVIESARPLSPAHLRSLKHHFPGAAVQETINPELIAGVRITVDGTQQLDESLRHILKHLFPNA